MHWRLTALIVCILACKATLQAQSPTIWVNVEGEILEAESGNPVPYVHISNLTTGLGTVSNTEGRFWVRIESTDTLLFSAIGYESYAFMLEPDQPSRRLRVTIEMNTSTQVLKPVKIFAYRSEEHLKQALIEMEVPESEPEVGMQIPGIRSAPGANPSVTLSGPISFFYNKFSRKVKAQKKLQKDIQYRDLLKSKYNEQVVMELTGLPEDKVEEFMNFCKIDEAFIVKSTPYDIALAVSKCLKSFNSQPDPE
jgi:hypothetical protein